MPLFHRRPLSRSSRPHRHLSSNLRRKLSAEALECRLMLATDFGGIQGIVFNDLNSNGVRDGGEPGLSGVSVRLTQSGSTLATVVTDSNGRYEFTGLTAGTYQVQQVPPPPVGFTQILTTPQSVTITPAQAEGTPGVSVDNFNGTPQTVTASFGGNNASTVADAQAIGGFRDMFVREIGNADEVMFRSNDPGGGQLRFNPFLTNRGQYIATWDGDNNTTTDDPSTLNPTGLGGVDLTSGGTISAFRLILGIQGVGQTLTLRIYTNGTNFSTITVPIPNSSGIDQETIIPYSSFVTGGGTGANFTNVGAVQLLHTATVNAADGGLDALATIGTTFVNQDFPNSSVTDLAITKIVNNPAPPLRGTVTFTVTLTNNGPANATNVFVTDQFPSGMTLQTATPSQGSYNATTGLWTVGNLNVGTSATLQLTGTADTLLQKVNTASISDLDQNDSNALNNSAQASVTPFAIDLSLTKVVSEPMPAIGTPFTFTISVTNNAVPDSPATTATNVAVTDVLPGNFALSSNSPSQGTYNATTGIWTVGTLPVGSTATLSLTGTATSNVKITNTAQVTAADQVDVDSTPGNNNASEDDQASVMVMPISPGIQVIKSTNGRARDVATGGPSVRIGSTAFFSYVVTNTGDVPLSTVRVVDDNGTPGNTADDFFATYLSGDTNGNDLLDLNERWVFQTQRIVTEGLHVNRARATGIAGTQTVFDDTVSNHTGVEIPAPQGKRRFLASSFRG